ncbi:MAG TPA: hypothetical protein VN524_03570 [Hyphomicrobiaceae bacterium]|jgi:hypothetical protein|nr:hypothetical protein [Hyphomicrobiaceae bacterium]
MDRKTHTLSDADIVSARAVTRRTLLAALGLGTGLAAAAVAYAQATPAPAPKPTRRDPCRDADHGPPSDGDGCGKPPIS